MSMYTPAEISRIISNMSPTQGVPSISADEHRPTVEAMLRARLRLGPYERVNFDFMALHETNTDVHIFIVKDGKPVTLTDPLDLFPSDRLMSQVRALL